MGLIIATLPASFWISILLWSVSFVIFWAEHRAKRAEILKTEEPKAKRFRIMLLGIGWALFLVVPVQAILDAMDAVESDKQLRALTIDLKAADQRVKELERKQEPRIITPEQKATFLENMKNAPRGRIDVSTFVNGPLEAESLAVALSHILKESGFTIGRPVRLPVGGDMTGVRIGVGGTNDSQVPELAWTVQAALKKISIRSTIVHDSTISSSKDISIVIGPKP